MVSARPRPGPAEVMEALKLVPLRMAAQKVGLKPRIKLADPDPETWAKERGIFLWSKQLEIARSVAVNRHTAVPSCHGAGKTFTAAFIAAHELESHEPGEVFVVTTAPTGMQVKALLWREINRLHNKLRLRGRTNQTEWYMGLRDSEELVAMGRKPSEYDEAAFQGIHAKRVVVIFDEASGIPSQLWEAAEGLMTSEESRFVAIGNPDDASSHFAQVCQPGSGWNVIPISAFDTPAFTNECARCHAPEDVCQCREGHQPIPRAVMQNLVSVMWVDERRDTWGEGSPLFEARVEGKFPEGATDGIIPLGWVRQCQDPELVHEPVHLVPVELGVDVGAGGDQTVVRERRGVKAGRVWRNQSRDSEEVAKFILDIINETGAARVKIDEGGIGWGIVGRLRGMRKSRQHRAEIVGVNFGSKSNNPVQFPLLRDELWWDVGRELSRTGGWDLTECDDSTIAQLTATKYDIDASGRIKAEKKAETKKRIGRSPDDADALLLAFYGGRRRARAMVSSG